MRGDHEIKLTFAVAAVPLALALLPEFGWIPVHLGWKA